MRHMLFVTTLVAASVLALGLVGSAPAYAEEGAAEYKITTPAEDGVRMKKDRHKRHGDWEALSDEEKAAKKERFAGKKADGVKKHGDRKKHFSLQDNADRRAQWEALSDEEKAERREKMQARAAERVANMTPEQKERMIEHLEKMLDLLRAE